MHESTNKQTHPHYTLSDEHTGPSIGSGWVGLESPLTDDDTVASGKADCGGRCFMIESSTGTLCPSSVTCKRILKVGILCYLEDVSSYTPFSTPQVVTQKGLTRV